MKDLSQIRKTLQATIILLILSISTQISHAQGYTSNQEIFGMGYSIETSRLLTNRMFIEGNYTIGRRSFELGISPGSYNTNGQGFMFKHKIFLNKKKNSNLSFNLKNHNFRTFAIYKFVMFNSSTNTLRKNFEVLDYDSFLENKMTAPTINTIEHYFGIGMELKTVDNLFLEIAGLGGVNFIKNNSKIVSIEDKLLPESNLDISWDISIGMNYRF